MSHKINRQPFFCFLIIFCTSFLCASDQFFYSNQQTKQALQQSSITIHTMYGDDCITESLLIDLLTCGALERLKYVRQYGVAFYAKPKVNSTYSRYEHSIGVLYLLRHYKASLVEQAAGLLHDVSHTVFSHMGDYFNPPQNPKYSYQDEIHAWFLEQYGVTHILDRYNIPLEDVLLVNGRNKIVKADDPDLGADRLEYVLRAGILTNMLSNNDVATILDDVFYQDGRWYFGSISNAKKFAQIALFNTEHIWGGVADALTYQWTSDALKRAIAIKEIEPEEINFSIDTELWERLCRSKDEKIQTLMYRIMNHEKYYTMASAAKHTNHIHTKFRGVDPFVKVGNEFKRLTECDAEFKQEFERTRKIIADGWYINLSLEVLNNP